MSPIPDFLDLPEPVSEGDLRCTDLADLRLAIRHPEGLDDGACISKAGRNRLIARSMLVRQICADGWVRTFATPYGREIARANASCRDGSEGDPVTPAEYRQRAAVAAVGRSSGLVTAAQVVERLREIAKRPGRLA